MPDLNNSNTTNQSTVAAFAILEEMARQSDPCRVTDLSNALEMPRARIYRYLQTLVSLGYVRQDPATERYRLTLKLFHLGQAIADGTQLLTAARPVMQSLRDKLGQTVTISVPELSGMRVLDIVRVETPVQIVTRPGAILSYCNSAQGKIALAFGQVDTSALPETDTPVNSKRLSAEIERARTTGWAVAPEEILAGVNSISAPVFDIEKRMVATITVVGPVLEIKPKPAKIYVEAVTKAAREISDEIGCMEYPL
jgi:IclR family transcriptional regulator, KDG regulon repressor